MQLLEEAESWLDEERIRSEQQADKARRQADELEAYKARKAAEKVANKKASENIMSDIAAQLAGGDSDEADPEVEESTRIGLVAASRASLTQVAQDETAAKKDQVKLALQRAREQIAKLKVQHEDV